MYIFICNAISDREVKEAVEAGAVIWTDVHEHNGCEPNAANASVILSISSCVSAKPSKLNLTVISELQ